MKIHTATIEGHTVTRTSVNRTYAFAIIHKYNVADTRARNEASVRASWKMNLAYYQKKAAGGMYHYNNGCAPTRIAADEQAWAQAILDKGVEATVAERLDAFDAENRSMAADGIHAYGGANWASRRDLAEKARKGLDVIVEATVVTK